MNKKLKLIFKNRSSEQGFAIPIAIGMGLIMILIASTMIVRSQGDQVSASAQKATAQSLAIAEGGMSRTLFKLNQSTPDVSSMLKRTYDPNGLLGSAVNEWTTANMPPCTTTTDLLSGTIGDSEYTVLAYRYDAATKAGTLLVKGLTGTSSESRVQQTFNISPKASSLIGVLGTNDIALGNNDIRGINGNVACTNPANCQVTCPYTTASARTGIGAGPQADIDGKIFLGSSVTTPALPNTPPVWNGTSLPVPTTEFTISLAAGITTNATFPRPSDFITHIAGTPYHYQIPNITTNGSEIITINTQQGALTNPTGDPVYFWVSGDIRMSGGSQLSHTASATNPTDFRIYGTSTSPSGQDILVGSGAAGMDGFIFAPNGRVGINGTGTIDGLVYAKSFGEIGANGNAIVNVPNNTNLANSLGDLAMYFSNQTDSINSWQRQAVP